MLKKKKLSSFIFHSSSTRGFTLIELLIVIAIIAILTTLLMANFVGIRQRGRDGQRKSNVYNIQSALELYRADVGSYPLTNEFPADCEEALENSDGSIVYMSEIPCDPTQEAPYRYSSDGTTYTLTACLENGGDSDKDDEAVYETSGCTTPASFSVVNP